MTKKLFGRLLLIGTFDEKFLKNVSENNKITYCDHLGEGEGVESSFFSEVVNIKKIRKRYKKKSFDFIVVNYDDIKNYTKYFVKDSIYLCNGLVYIENYDKSIIKKYKRYEVKIEEKKELVIHVKNAKTKFVKDRVYYVYDTINNLLDYLSAFLSM